MNYNYLIFLSLLTFTACNFLKVKEEVASDAADSKVLLARVGNKYFYQEDLQHLKNLKVHDSIMTQRQVQTWVRKELMMREAKQIPSINYEEINKKVEEYRYSLLSFEYEKYYIKKNLNLEVSEQEIKEYYDKNTASFILQNKVVQLDYLVFPKSIAKKNNLGKLFRSNMTSDNQELKQFSLNFSEKYILEDSSWYKLEEISKETPFYSLVTGRNTLRKNKVYEFQDSDRSYFLKIKDIRLPKQVSPLQLVERDIKKNILNKRKIHLTRTLKDKIYKIAQNNNEFEIFTSEK